MNPFVSPSKHGEESEEEIYAEQKDEAYIRTYFEAYQLKTLF